jgi:hypothetical protein
MLIGYCVPSPDGWGQATCDIEIRLPRGILVGSRATLPQRSEVAPPSGGIRAVEGGRQPARTPRSWLVAYREPFSPRARCVECSGGTAL